MDCERRQKRLFLQKQHWHEPTWRNLSHSEVKIIGAYDSLHGAAALFAVQMRSTGIVFLSLESVPWIMLNYFLVGFPRGFTCQTLPVDFGLFLLKRLKAAGHHIASKLRVPEKKHNKHVSMRNFSRFGLYQKSQTKTNKLHTSYSQVSLDLWVFHLFTPCWFRGFLGEDLHASGWLPFFSSKPTAFPICHGQRSHRERPAVHKKEHTPNLALIQVFNFQ